VAKIADFGHKWGKSLWKCMVCIPPPSLSGSIPLVQCHTVIVNFCSMWFCQPLHIHKLFKDDMIRDDKNNGWITNYKTGSWAWNIINSRAIALVILNNGNLLVYLGSVLLEQNKKLTTLNSTHLEYYLLE